MQGTAQSSQTAVSSVIRDAPEGSHNQVVGHSDTNGGFPGIPAPQVSFHLIRSPRIAPSPYPIPTQDGVLVSSVEGEEKGTHGGRSPNPPHPASAAATVWIRGAGRPAPHPHPAGHAADVPLAPDYFNYEPSV